MKIETFDRLRYEFDHLVHDSMRSVPDGWTRPLVNLLGRLHALSNVGPAAFQGSTVTWTQVRIEVYMSSAMAFVSPMMPSGKWNPIRAMECVDALNAFHGETQETCSVCGAEGHLRMRMLGGEKEGVFCDQHAAECSQRLDRTAALYQEVRELFPQVHGKAIDLAVPDHLFDLLASTLRSILKLVRKEDMVGKVVITRVEMDDGALYVRVRYHDLTAAHLSVQMAVNEVVADLEVRADDASRRVRGVADEA